MKLLLCITLLISTAAFLVEGFSSGAPAAACDTLAPSPATHGTTIQPTATNPYRVDLSAFSNGAGGYEYSPGQTYTLSVSGVNNETFRGFFVQARHYLADNSRVGVFTVIDGGTNSRLSSCTVDTDGITHNNRNDKMSVYFNWTAPADLFTGPILIRFEFAVVQTINVYWANEQSPLILQHNTGGLTSTTMAPEITASTEFSNSPATRVTSTTSTETSNGSTLLIAIIAALIVLVALLTIILIIGAGFVTVLKKKAKKPNEGFTLSHVTDLKTTVKTDGGLTTIIQKQPPDGTMVFGYNSLDNVKSISSSMTKNEAYGETSAVGKTAETTVHSTQDGSDPAMRTNTVYEELTEPQIREDTYDYACIPDSAIWDPSTAKNLAYGDITPTVGGNQYYYVNEGLGGAAEVRTTRNEAYTGVRQPCKFKQRVLNNH